jgi:two-component system response regulator FixJ
MSSVTLDPVFIVDDDPAARESVAALVRSHGLEAETYDSAEDFLARFDRRRDGCLVVDVRMTGMSGIDLQEQLRREGVELPVIVITGYGDVASAVRAMRTGAFTFLEKPCNDQQLWESICLALQGQTALRGLRVQRGENCRNLATLSADEHRVLEKLMDGKANKTIAKELDLGLRTVELRRATILKKMQTASLAGLVRMVVQMSESQPAEKASDESTTPSESAAEITAWQNTGEG